MRAGVQLIPLMPMPGWITEGPINAMQSAPDWRFRTDGIFNTGSNNPPGVFNGAFGAPEFRCGPGSPPGVKCFSMGPQFDTYAWRPSGDGTQPMYPTEADLSKIYGYWPVLDSKPSRADLGAAADDGSNFRLFLQVTSTLAIVAIAGLGVAAYVSERKKGRR